jgi:hypothetical protein
MIQSDPTITNGRLYYESSIRLYKKIGSSIRSVDPNSGDFRIARGRGEKHNSLHYYLSERVVSKPGDFPWHVVKDIFTIALGLSAPATKPKVNDIFDNLEINFGESYGVSPWGTPTTEGVGRMDPIPSDPSPPEEEGEEAEGAPPADEDLWDPRLPSLAECTEEELLSRTGFSKPGQDHGPDWLLPPEDPPNVLTSAYVRASILAYLKSVRFQMYSNQVTVLTYRILRDVGTLSESDMYRHLLGRIRGGEDYIPLGKDYSSHCPKFELNLELLDFLVTFGPSDQ